MASLSASVLAWNASGPLGLSRSDFLAAIRDRQQAGQTLEPLLAAGSGHRMDAGPMLEYAKIPTIPHTASIKIARARLMTQIYASEGREVRDYGKLIPPAAHRRRKCETSSSSAGTWLPKGRNRTCVRPCASTWN
jgi:hypothetical protein